MAWKVTSQGTDSLGNLTFGTISWEPENTDKWYGRYEESDWSAWVDNNPPVIQRKRVCEESGHDWADTGLAKTWCKKCDLSGRWVLGRVEIEPAK